MGKTLTRAIDAAARAVQPDQLRAVDYLRVSTDDQAKGYGISYTGKRTAKHIKTKGWYHVGTFADEEVSGSLPWREREDMSRLVGQALQTPRPFDVVVVNEERAIGRAGRAFWPWVWDLEDLGIFVAIVKGDYDNTTQDGRSRMRDAAGRAEDERELIRDRTQGGIQDKAEEGGHVGGRPPFGWRIKRQGKRGESYLAKDKTSDKTLHRAWELIVREHRNRDQSAAALNLVGMFGPGGRPWTGDSLAQVLKGDPIQRGVRVFRNPASAGKRRGTQLDRAGQPLYGETVTIKLDRIFTKKEIRQLNAALERTSRASREGTAVHPLSTRLIGLCGSHYTGSLRAEEKHGVYVCSGRTPKPTADKAACSCSQIGAQALETKVWTEVCALLSNPARLMAMASDWADVAQGAKANHNSRIAELEKQVAQQDRAIAAAVLVASQERNAAKAIKAAIGQLQKERDRLDAHLAEAKAWQEEAAAAEQRASDLQTLAKVARDRLHEMTPPQQAEVLSLLDVRVTILGSVPPRTRRDDQVTGWFRSRERVVPTLSDDAWALAETALTPLRRGRPARPPRLAMEAILHKARTGCAWRNLPEEYGPWETVVGTWRRWQASGEWEQMLNLLADTPGTTVPEDRVLLPALRVEGRLDPRLLIDTQEAPKSRLANRHMVGLTYVL
ncbi:transposase [Streptomyces scopuliridis]|uniref:transposase n=1 Tax=Streptomyces scopuliridis TaxID=452529 RepID=UPI0036C93284